MPLNDLKKLIAAETPNKNKTVLLYCRSGKSSAAVVKLFKNLNYSEK